MIEHHPTSRKSADQLADQGEPYPEATAAFVERFAADLTEAGMPRMPSRVFACLLASQDSALSSAELAARLQVSPAAVSGAVRYLAQVHMISRERQPGSRRERYRLRHDIWFEAIVNREAIIKRWVATLEAGIGAVGADTPAGQRMVETSEFFEFLRGEWGDLLDRWRAQRAQGIQRAQGGHGAGGTDGADGAGQPE